MEFGERLCKEALESVPCRYFLYDGKLLSELRFCAWDSPAFAGSHGLWTVEECGCPPKPWRRRTEASAGYAVPQVPRVPARGAPLEVFLLSPIQDTKLIAAQAILKNLQRWVPLVFPSQLEIVNLSLAPFFDNLGLVGKSIGALQFAAGLAENSKV